jgi:type II secretory pathway pseudopilin PulG
MLLTLMLFVALLAVASLGWIESIEFQLKRDREEELIHRGVQYSRAIRHYVKKFGTYPGRIQDLESTNGIRFLRKHYKDPITGKDFKLLHMNDVQISFSPGAASGLPPAAASSQAQPGAPGALTLNAAAPGGAGPSSIPSNAQSSQPGGGNDGSNSQNPQDAAGSPNGQGDQGSTGAAQSGVGNGPTFGGLPIIGVASTSKEKTIREFNRKNHYNQWQFIYDPSTDRGGLLTTPNQPPIQGATQINQPQNGSSGAGFSFSQGGGNQPQQPAAPQPQPNQQ